MEKRNVATSVREVEDDDTETMLKKAADRINAGAGAVIDSVKKASAAASVRKAMEEDEKAEAL